MSFTIDNTQWVESRQQEFQTRIGAANAFWPELKRALLELSEHEPFKGRVTVNSSAEEPYSVTVSAGLFDLKFAADVLSDTVFYAFTSAPLKRVIPRDTAIFHHGQLRLTRGPWGVIDNPGAEVHKVFVDDPQSVQYIPLADQVARWSLEQLLGGYPTIAALEQSVEAARADAAKKEANGGGAGHK